MSKDQYRILIPSEYEILRKNIPKTKHRIIIDLLLFSGMRYSELSYISGHLSVFDDKNRAILLPAEATKTKKGRTIHLTPVFTKALDDFVRSGDNMEVPGIIAMGRNLKRWQWYGRKAGESIVYISPKTFRKTWESWLLAAGYPSFSVALSQGHKEIISYGHYANLDPRLKSEMDKVRRYTEGWGI